MNTPAIETERLILRRFEEDDLPSVFKIFSGREVNRFLPWFPLRTMDDAKAFYEERFESRYRQERAYHYAVCLKSDNVPIGYVNVGTEESYDFGYGLCREFWQPKNQTVVFRMYQLNLDGDDSRIYRKYWEISDVHYIEKDV